MEERDIDKASAESGGCSDFFCEACKTNGHKNVSTNYCRECKEYLCDKCTKQHKMMKRTKEHIPVAADEKLNTGINRCVRSTDEDVRPKDTKK